MNEKKIRHLVFFLVSAPVVFLSVGYFSHFFSAGRLASAPVVERQSLGGPAEFLEEKGKEKVPENGEVSLIALGDVSYSRAVGRAVKRAGDQNYPFLKIGDQLKEADLVFGNLETPITEGPEIPDFEMLFRSDPGTEQVLKRFGFSVVSLANNHTPNFGEKGLRDTFSYLESVGIKYVGAGKNREDAFKPVYVEKNGIKLAFLAYNSPDVVPSRYEATEIRAGTAFMRIEEMTRAVGEAKKNSDFVVVSMHAGIEYVPKPNSAQIDFARAAVDAGADLVLGHHPHVVQTMEKYKGKFIFYSLGNFVFDQPHKQETREGLAIKINFSKTAVKRVSFLPVFMEKLAQPRMAEGDEAEKILAGLDFPLKKADAYFVEP